MFRIAAMGAKCACACESQNNSTAELASEAAMGEKHYYDIDALTSEVAAEGATDKAPFTVTVWGARWLRNSDWQPGMGKAECYVEVSRSFTHIYTTSVLYNSMQPVWAEEFRVTEYKKGDTFEFTVYTVDSMENADIQCRVCLGQAKLTPDQFAKKGFNGEVMMQKAGSDVQAYVALKIKPKGKQYPPGPPSTFTITVAKGADQDYGVVVDTTDNQNLMVASIEDDGAFAEYNKDATPEEQVVRTDFITMVNGVSDPLVSRLNQFRESKATCVVTRSTQFTCVLERADLKTPLGLTFFELVKKTGQHGIPIKSIVEGVVKDYNDKCKTERDKLAVRDRIISVKGRAGIPDDIKASIEGATGSFQIGVLRATTDSTVKA